MTGRPSGYTPELGERICDLLVLGEDGETPMSLRAVCRRDDMPDLKTVMRWLKANDAFRQQYADARELQQELSHDDIVEIADNATDDVIFLTDEDESGEGARPAIKHSAIQRARLQIDTRKWIMARMAPKKYGDRQAVDLDAKHIFENLTDDQLNAELERAATEAGVSLALGGKGEAGE